MHWKLSVSEIIEHLPAKQGSSNCVSNNAALTTYLKLYLRNFAFKIHQSCGYLRIQGTTLVTKQLESSGFKQACWQRKGCITAKTEQRRVLLCVPREEVRYLG